MPQLSGHRRPATRPLLYGAKLKLQDYVDPSEKAGPQCEICFSMLRRLRCPAVTLVDFVQHEDWPSNLPTDRQDGTFVSNQGGTAKRQEGSLTTLKRDAKRSFL